MTSSAMDFAANGKNAAVPLSGGEEVPARATLARGNATFHLAEDGLSMSYKLIVGTSRTWWPPTSTSHPPA